MSDRRVPYPPRIASPPVDITPEMIAAAPELAVLALLDEALRVTRDALLAAQPSLVGEPPAWRVDPELVAARRLLRDVATIERSVAHYWQGVLRRLDDTADRDDDDLPF
jgi:hypothetical protein